MMGPQPVEQEEDDEGQVERAVVTWGKGEKPPWLGKELWVSHR